MGPVELSLRNHAQEIHSRLLNTRTPVRIPILDQPHKMQAIIDGLREQLAQARSEIEKANAKIEFLQPKFYPNPVHRIINMVSRREGIAKIDIISHRRTAGPTFARQIAYYLSATTTTYSLPQIGRYFCGRDHSTVFCGREKIKKLRLVDPVLDVRLRWYEEQIAQFALDKRGA